MKNGKVWTSYLSYPKPKPKITPFQGRFLFEYYGWVRDSQVEHLCTSAVRIARKLEALGFTCHDGRVGVDDRKGRDE